MFTQGRGALTTNSQTGIAAPTTAFNQNTAGATQFGNALGVNGAAGNAAALAAFKNNPGYQFQLQQGDNAIQAFNQANGLGNSGNDLIDLSKFNQGLAGTSWNNYVSNLANYLPQQTATGGQVLAGNQNLGQGLMGSFANQGGAAYGSQVGQGNAQAQADYANLNASQNFWNMLGNVATAGMKAYAGGGGGGG